jgi:hypothetical protein
MPRGGFRPGSGRRKGSLNNATLARMPTNLSGTAYLRLVVNDAGADVLRRDRAAAVLAGIENRRDLKPGKKELAQEGARLAGWGTSWWRLLNDWDASDFNPDGLTPEDRAEWDAKQRAKRAQPKAAKPTHLRPLVTSLPWELTMRCPPFRVRPIVE